MNNVIQLRRPLKVGDKVRIDNVRIVGTLIYTISRIEGRRLYGYLQDDKIPLERWITRDYAKPVKRIIQGKEVIARVTHLDGRHIQ